MSKNSTPGLPGQDPTNPVEAAPVEKPDGDFLAELEALVASVEKALPAVKRKAFLRDIVIHLRRAAWAAEKLAALGPEEAEAAGHEEAEDDAEGPITEEMPAHIPTLALTSDGSVLLSLHYVEGADLSDRTIWSGIVLSEAEAFEVLDRMSEAADDTAGHVGGRIIAEGREDEGGEGGEKS